uniref:hypothetical protein n=1 Tax=Psychrobacter sp. TaxID=56811 RepID=UPI001599A4C0|nr:hypothetical protein [Psychrobacter sp.]QJS05740.1 hypothetical protein [Psychrobacter sp.]
MSKHHINWKIDRIGALIELDAPITIIANDWSQTATSLDADLHIGHNDSDPSQPIVVLTLLDGKKFVIGYFPEQNNINIHLDFNEPFLYDKEEFYEELSSFYDKIKEIIKNYLSKRILSIKIGVEVVDYIGDNENAIDKLKSNFDYFSGMDDDIDEVSLKIKKKISDYNDLYIIQMIEICNKERLKIVLDSGMEEFSNRQILSTNIELELILDLENISYEEINIYLDSLKACLVDLVYKDFLL